MAPSTSHACSSCRSPLRAGETICPQCGTPVSAVGGAVPPASDPGRDTPGSYPPGGGTFSWDAIVQRLKEITLGEYDILTELGRGGMAAVFLAHEFALNRKVALKVMSPAMMMGEGMIDRFYAEAVTQANLVHPHIVGVHAVRQEDDLHYFVMQYVPGRSLLQVLRAELAEGRALSLAVIRSLVHQIGSALAFAHRRGVIHRDIKPANVLLNGDGDAVVTDFGIAKVAANPSQTMTGTVVGTAPYMSPEQCYASELTGASDQYSLGILTYELLTGAPPFSGNSFAVMQAHTLEEPPPLHTRRPDCPPDMVAALMRMLAKPRDARFPDIHAALVGLGAKPASSDTHDPVRMELVRLSDVRGVEAGLTSVLHVPLSPIPRTRRQGDARRPTLPTPQRAVEAYTPPSTPAVPPDAKPRTVLLRLSDPPARVEVGERFRLQLTGTDDTGAPVRELSPRWSSSNPSVARVAAETGDIDALLPGMVDIIVTAGDAVATTRFQVSEAAVAKVVVTAPTSIEVGTGAMANAEVLDARGEPLQRPVTWSSSDTAIASVTRTGAIAALAPGVTRVIAAAGSVRGEAELRVAAPSVARIEISGVPRVLGTGETMIASATLYDQRGKALSARDLAGRAVRWDSSDPGVLSVSATGALRAVRHGQARLLVRCTEVTSFVDITVGLAPIAKIDVQGITSTLRTGAQRRLSVVASDAEGRQRELPVEWTSSDGDVVTVDSSGLVVARRAGQATLRARCGTGERSFPLTVLEVVPLTTRLARLWQMPAARGAAGVLALALIVAAVVTLRGGRTVVAEGPLPPQATEPAQGPAPTPTSPDSTPDRTPPGTATRVEPTGDTVSRAPAANAPSRLSIAGPRQQAVERGEPFVLRAGFDPPETRGSPAITWTTSNPAIAAVDRSGRVSPLAAGSATITASADDRRDAVTVIIREPTIARLMIGNAPASMQTGDSARASAQAYSRSDRAIPTSGVTWRSSNSGVLYVNPTTGWMRAQAPGNAEVFAEVGGIRSEGRTVSVEATARPEPSAVDSTRSQPASGARPIEPPAEAVSRGTLLARARETLAACRDVYVERNTARIGELARGGSQAEEANRAFVLATLRDGVNVAIAAAGMDEPVIEGTSATANIRLQLTWRSSFGGNRSADLTVRAALQRTADAWSLANCRIIERR